jgi:hypothetical protein
MALSPPEEGLRKRFRAGWDGSLGIHPALLTLPGAKHIKGLVVGCPTLGGFVDAAGKGKPVAGGGPDHTFLVMENGSIGADLPVMYGQADSDLKVALIDQPSQEFSAQVSGAAIPGLHTTKRELAAELLLQQLFRCLAAARGLQIRPVDMRAGEALLPVVIPKAGHGMELTI